MKLSSIFAVVALVAAPAGAAAQGLGVRAASGARAAAARLAPPRPSARVRGGALPVAFANGRLDQRGVRGRLRRRTFAVGLYPFWGWDCAPSGPCSWDDDAPSLTPADYDAAADAPPAPGDAVIGWSRPAADSNECSDWVWRPRLHHSVCARRFRG